MRVAPSILRSLKGVEGSLRPSTPLHSLRLGCLEMVQLGFPTNSCYKRKTNKTLASSMDITGYRAIGLDYIHGQVSSHSSLSSYLTTAVQATDCCVLVAYVAVLYYSGKHTN